MDRISHLPDPIRSHIVSLLPLRDAFRTRILSTQWRHSHTSLPNLNFLQLNRIVKNNFKLLKDIIDQTLILHDGSNIGEFTIGVKLTDHGDHGDVDDGVVSPLHLNTWLIFAVRHNVQRISLLIPTTLPVPLPCAFFTCQTLRTLTIQRMDIKLPSVFHFPLLHMLILGNVTLSEEDRINSLFSVSSCPMLTCLLISHCQLKSITTLTIASPRLNDFTLHNSDNGFKINLFSPNLKKIDYMAAQPPNISVKAFSSLSEVNFHFSYPLSLVDTRLSKIVMGLHNVEELFLYGGCVEFLTRDQGLLASSPTLYPTVKHLCLAVNYTNSQVQVAIFLLRAFPNLQTLRIIFPEDPNRLDDVANTEGYWESQEFSAVGTLNHLRKVDILWFRGDGCELGLIRHLLENAKLMEKMNVTYLGEKNESAERELLDFKKASPSATISFEVFRF